MSSFTNALILSKLSRQEWEVYDDFTYEVGSLGSGETITVPKGFITDLASIPRIFWSILPKDGNYSQAAVLHDWICFNKGMVEQFYTPNETSRIFLEAMKVLKVPYFTRHAMYWSVFIFCPRW